jgi:hypothetical protein
MLGFFANSLSERKFKPLNATVAITATDAIAIITFFAFCGSICCL